jgi:hypothetical protein
MKTNVEGSESDWILFELNSKLYIGGRSFMKIFVDRLSLISLYV